MATHLDLDDVAAHSPLAQKQLAALRAEVEDWRKLLDPANLHANLLQGKPAKLTRAQLAHLLGQDCTALLAEVERLRAEVEALRADAQWKLTAESLPEDGRLVLFEVDAKPPSRLEDYDGQVFACRYFAETFRYSSGFGVPGVVFQASRWRYVDPPPAIAAQRGEGE